MGAIALGLAGAGGAASYGLAAAGFNAVERDYAAHGASGGMGEGFFAMAEMLGIQALGIGAGVVLLGAAALGRGSTAPVRIAAAAAGAGLIGGTATAVYAHHGTVM